MTPVTSVLSRPTSLKDLEEGNHQGVHPLGRTWSLWPSSHAVEKIKYIAVSLSAVGLTIGITGAVLFTHPLDNEITKLVGLVLLSTGWSVCGCCAAGGAIKYYTDNETI
jgi:hypothetical protein